MKKQIEKSLNIEREEYKQDNVQFVIIHRKPPATDLQNVKEELYRIFKKYE
ncbi:hypothetical protein [Clostridium sp. KNHs205]|uniref:hypothetical protein n=1 Tax=Clostridium sp. KNHs205 TaxID=1449050 RepID=UPI000B321901|nr:hypothetical protein [Clostridium sp. KNHs205]